MEEQSLADLCRKVARQRAVVAEVAERVKVQREAFERSIADLQAERLQAEQRLDALETALRANAVADFAATGNKKPTPGVAIVLRNMLIYRLTDAFSWAKDHGVALKLDVPAFEKVAGAAREMDAELGQIVKHELVPQAQIARDLDAVLSLLVVGHIVSTRERPDLIIEDK